MRRRRPSLYDREVGIRELCFEAFSAFTFVTARLLAQVAIVATLIIEGFSRFVASSTASTATGWNNQIPGRDLHPLKIDTFARRTVIPISRNGNTIRCYI
jgi:hypothetical protein